MILYIKANMKYQLKLKDTLSSIDMLEEIEMQR